MNRRNFLALSAAGALVAGAPVYWPRRWRYIAIHHSGSSIGDIALLRRVHRERQPKDPVDEIPYHFVIGNGNGLGLGEVVATDRWHLGLWGAHLSASNMDRNFRGIGVCLIGNFEAAEVSELQFQAAVSLTRGLVQRYGISPDRLAPHGRIAGESTLCPGRHFPIDRFRQSVFEGQGT